MKVTLAALAALFAAGVSANPLLAKRATKCNGYSQLCNKQYSNVTYVGAHNSYAVGQTSNSAANQNVNVTTQLNDGVRLLQIQGHTYGNSGSGISLCHTSCALYNGGTLEDYMKNVTSWLDENKNDVVTIIISNPSDIDVSKWAQGIQSAGLNRYAYTSDSGSVDRDNWPTLQNMISQNKRVVIFMDRKTDISQTNFILPEFNNIWENPYDQRSLPFNCTADRYNRTPSKLMYLHNNVIDKEQSLLGQTFSVPNTDNLTNTNSYEVVYDAVNSCAKQHNYYPTFILVDYYNIGGGGPLQAAAKMNGVQYDNSTLSSSESSTGSSATAGALAMLPPHAAFATTLALCVAFILSTA
ncbi:hypothetical protein MCUN1_000428 [Malassezia cuniculi]|uniref:PLC-like phosphodiesterase n=1 Tax=Malassezia cuniculi TaxID=948313 RepID=A0AAF0J523_9BASI|nr:hypothetical protein MCUN1_000428 [Malassezia cuniculi]